MGRNYEVKLIFHLKEIKENYFIKIFETKKQLQGEDIIFEFSGDIFDDFQMSRPIKVYLLDETDFVLKEFTFNLSKGSNYYHFYSFNNTFSFECLFYKEDNLKISVKGEEIKEYDIDSNFKRYSFVNLATSEININGNNIDIFRFCPKIPEKNNNSIQLSFYDISNKYIVSKYITPIQEMNFFNFYKTKNSNINQFSNELEKIKENQNDFKYDISNLAKVYELTFNKIEKELNLNLPKKKLENLFNKEEYLNFFYSYSKMRLFFHFYKKQDINLNNFTKVYQSFEQIYSKIKEDKIYSNYDKIIIMVTFASLLGKFDKCDTFLGVNFDFIKVTNVEENSVINKAMKFLNEYIKDFNEDSPSFFKLVEINSGYGYYFNQNKTHRVFTYDIIDVANLKMHLKETLPSVICFYDYPHNKNLAFTETTTGGICINKSKLLTNKKLKLNKNYHKMENTIKNVAMKLVERLMHECFGHSKFQFHPDLYYKKICPTPKKCFDNKTLKELVKVKDKNKKNAINILSNDKKGDSGNYYESSFGKLKGTDIYTFSYLKIINNVGILLDSPELFSRKEELKKLHNYAYLKYLYENNLYKTKKSTVVKKGKKIKNTKKKITEEIIDLCEENEEKEDMTVIDLVEEEKTEEKEDMIVIDLVEEETEEKNVKRPKKEAKKILKGFVDFEKELNYYNYFFSNKQFIKNSTAITIEDINNTVIKKNKDDNNNLLGRKKLQSKSKSKNDEESYDSETDEELLYDREYISKKYFELEVSDPKRKYYYNLYVDATLKD